MNRLTLAFSVLVSVLLFSGTAMSRNSKDILDQKEELEKTQQQVEDSRANLKSLKRQESDVQKKISKYDQRIESNKKVVQRLNRELRKIQRQVRDAEGELAFSKEALDLNIRRYLGNIRQFYMTTRPTVEAVWMNPNEEAEQERQIVLLTALASYESGNVEQVSGHLASTVELHTQLQGQQIKVRKLKSSKETSTSLERSRKEKQQKELEKLRRKKTQEADRLLTLEQAAREMEMILVRLERERQHQRRQRKTDETSFFAGLKGRLRSPFRGKITVPFGELVDKITHLKSFSPGVHIKGKPGGQVFAVAAGSVAYAGDLRGYGNFVIIDHDGIYFTTYAGLGKTYVNVGELVATGTGVGTAAADGLVKFELRKGREPLDPIQWIRIDAF